ncbi:MAG: 16S rRNA (cytidine(1402)-2'-O)-methyltransferase [bacterium]
MTGAARGPGRGAPGVLRVVGTPLGNLADLSPRGREALESADAIAAEDTRRTGRLLELLGLPKKPLLALFAPRERERAPAIVARLVAGENVALVTDGGTPNVSDPGAVLIAAARAAGVRVEPIPGPSAVAVALSVSSNSGDRFVFEGFLPAKSQARRTRLEALARDERTIVLYEAPHRLAAALADLVATFGPVRRCTIVREATKMHEEIVEGALAELATRFSGEVRGEVVLVLEGAAGSDDRVSLDASALASWAVGLGLTPDRAAREVAELTGTPRSRLLRRLRGGEPES